MARILQLSDLHTVPRGTLVSGVLDTPALLHSAIDKLLARMDAIGPIDAVLVTGDISNDGSAGSYEVARAELDRLELPLLVLPGNCDKRGTFRRAFHDLPIIPAANLIDWVAEVGDTWIIGLDTLVEGQGSGILRPKSLELLSDALETSEGQTVLIALHHPPLCTGVRFLDAAGLKNPQDLEKRLASHTGPLHILAGHTHGVYHGWLAGHLVSTAPSLCSAFVFDRRADAPVGFMTAPTGCVVIDTAEGGIRAEIPLEHGDGPFPF